MSRASVIAALCGLVACSRPNPIFGLDDDGSGSSSEPTTTGVLDTTAASSSSMATSADSGSGGSSAEDSSSGAMSMPECGNAVTEEGEECDDGPNNADDGYCLLDCTKNECGDGHLAPDQLCDDQNADPTDGCDACKLTSCGNGMVEVGEECDDGNRIDEDDCHDCIVSTCGDGITWPAEEECDDHNNEDNDGCSAICLMEFCGDGIVQTDEECDLPRAPLQCVEMGSTYDLDCDDQCNWAIASSECCMEADSPCLNQVPCCPGLSCDDMTQTCSP